MSASTHGRSGGPEHMRQGQAATPPLTTVAQLKATAGQLLTPDELHALPIGKPRATRAESLTEPPVAARVSGPASHRRTKDHRRLRTRRPMSRGRRKRLTVTGLVAAVLVMAIVALTTGLLGGGSSSHTATTASAHKQLPQAKTTPELPAKPTADLVQDQSLHAASAAPKASVKHHTVTQTAPVRHIRTAATTHSAVVDDLHSGQKVVVSDTDVKGEDPYGTGNATWYMVADGPHKGQYFWSGGVLDGTKPQVHTTRVGHDDVQLAADAAKAKPAPSAAAVQRWFCARSGALHYTTHLALYQQVKASGAKTFGTDHAKAVATGCKPRYHAYSGASHHSSSGSGTSSSTHYSGSVVSIARQIVPAGQFQCFSNIVNSESGWNYLAVNKSSGAYGLMQALPGSKMASVGSDWRTNPVTQIKWGLRYMNSRYGSPCAAWSFWRVHHWY